MTSFWIIVAGMLSVSTFIIAWPLLPFNRNKLLQNHLGQKQDNIDIFRNRLEELESEKNQGNLDQQTFEQLKTELEKSLLVDVENEYFEQVLDSGVSGKQWMISGFIALLIAVSSLALYLKLGRSDDYAQFLTLQQVNNPDSSQEVDLEQAIAQLTAKLQQDPSDVAKWYLLAKSYSALEQYEKSAQVFSKIAGMIGQDDPFYPAIKASYAQALFMASGETMTSEVMQAVNQALSADPLEPNALLLLGLDAYSREDYPKALTLWQKARQKSSAEQQQNFLDPAIMSAREKMAERGEVYADKEAGVSTDATPANITINVDIVEDLKKQVSPEQTIFVFARASGQRMPLAAERLKVKDLPAKIKLNDSKAVMPTAKLSSAQQVDITARVSLSGQAIAQPGDFYTTKEKVAVVNDGSSLDLIIDQVVR